MRIRTDKQDYKPGEKVIITVTDFDTSGPVQFQLLNYGADGMKGTSDDLLYKSWTVSDGSQGDAAAAAGTLETSWTVPGTALNSTLEVTAQSAGADGKLGTADDVSASAVFTDAKPTAPTNTQTVSVRLDQWADGAVKAGNVPGDESWVNGNLNATKAHYNEGDSIPYRAILDNLATNVVYGLMIEWDTVDSRAYALDYLTGYNFAFEGNRHPNEPDVTPLTGVTEIAPNATAETADIPSDGRLLTGFGSQFGITGGLGSGTPSGAQSVSVFGTVNPDSVSVGPITYNADLTKASTIIYFTYTGTGADNADTVVVAWGGHIASKRAWADDTGETVQTASEISGSPYHMRILSLFENEVARSIGNQDRSLSADAVVPEPPTAGDVTLVVDEDDLPTGNNDVKTGDTDPSGELGTLLTTNATSISFADLNGDPVLDTSGSAVKSAGSPLTYFWNAATSTLYASTGTTSTTAEATAVFKIVITASLTQPGSFNYAFTLLDQVDHPAAGTGGVGDNTEDPNVLITIPYAATGPDGTVTANFNVTIDDDIPIENTAAAAVTGAVREDGMTLTAGNDAVGGADLSEGNRAVGTTTAADETSGAAGALLPLFKVGADEPGTMGITSANLTGLLPELLSRGEAVSYVRVDANTLEAQAGASTQASPLRTMFTLKVNADGSWSFDLDDQLDHVDGIGENKPLKTLSAGVAGTVNNIDFTKVLTFTDKDGDTVQAQGSGKFVIEVTDDIPVEDTAAAAVTGAVREDGMTLTAGNDAVGGADLSEGNRAVGTTTAADETSGAAGALLPLFKVGADEPGTMGITSANLTGLLPELLSRGEAVSYVRVDANTLEAQAGASTQASPLRTVFTLKVNADGSWSFDLDDQLDHVDGIGENKPLKTLSAGVAGTVNNIDFTKVLTFTDKDGDTVAATGSGKFVIEVTDDIPVEDTAAAAVTGAVREDGMTLTAGNDAVGGADLSEGNRAVGTTTAADETSGAAGALLPLFKVGADEPGTMGITSANLTGLLPELLSRGEAVSYVRVDANTLEAQAGANTQASPLRTVFTLKVNADGSWSFDLDDQLDHVDGIGENKPLKTLSAGVAGTVNNIDFTKVLTFTDKDGDTVQAQGSGKFVIEVTDDIPVEDTAAAAVTGAVREDGMTLTAGNDAVGGADLSEGNRAVGTTTAADETSGAAGALLPLFKVGADEPGTMGITSANLTGLLPELLSRGEAVSYVRVDANTLEAQAGASTQASPLRTVFTLKVNADGSWSFDLDDQLDHVDGIGENKPLKTLSAGVAGTVNNIDFTKVLTFTDKDGDTVQAQGSGKFVIEVTDDIPVEDTAAAAVTGAVREDGMTLTAGNDAVGGADLSEGNRAVGTTTAADETSGAAGALLPLFKVGADEPGTMGITSANLTGLLPELLSRGEAVSYVRVDANTLEAQAGANTQASPLRTVFTLKVNADGSWSFDLDDQLDHVDGIGENKPLKTLSAGVAGTVNNIDFTKVLTFTDKDGDTVQAQGSGKFVIEVTDDIPVEDTAAAAVTGAVREDGMTLTAGNDAVGGADLSEGNRAVGTTTAADETSGAAGALLPLFKVGADEPGTMGITSANLTGLLPELLSRGEAVSYVRVDANTLEAQAGASTQASPLRTVFTLKVNADGSWSFDLDDQLDHVDGIGENKPLKTLSAGVAGTVNNIDFTKVLTFTDKDGDTVQAQGSGKFVIEVTDDIPVINGGQPIPMTTLFNRNATQGVTGNFDYALGADERSNYPTGTDFGTISLTGYVDTADNGIFVITATPTGTTTTPGGIVTRETTTLSELESATQAVFNVQFNYKPTLNQPTQTATGTLVFNKAIGTTDGTYTFSLDAPLSGYVTVSTGQAGAVFNGYEPNSTTLDTSQPEVAVATLSDDFHVQFTGAKEPGGNGESSELYVANPDGTDQGSTFEEGELFFQGASWVSVSGSANGVAGDTMQSGEVLDMDFFLDNPSGQLTGPTAVPDARAEGIYLRFDGIGSAEDLMVVLKLDDGKGDTLTRALIVGNEDIIRSNDNLTGDQLIELGNVPLDNNDGVVFIESNDYNFGTKKYLIYGAQILGSTETVTGVGYELNGTTGTSGASTGVQKTFGYDATVAEVITSEGTSEPIKISNIGFKLSNSVNIDAMLNFTVPVVDYDGDTVSASFSVKIDGTTPASGTTAMAMANEALPDLMV